MRRRAAYRGALAAALALTVALAADGPTTPAADGPTAPATDRPALRFLDDPHEAGFGTVVVTGLHAGTLARLGGLPPEALERILTVRLAGAGDDGDIPAMLGRCAVTPDGLRFTPLLPFAAGQEYRARFDGPRAGDLPPLTLAFRMPIPPAVEPARVVAIYPGADQVPSNLLRFYVHFSAPMLRRDVPSHVRLLDAAGAEVPLPFVELEQGIWDPGDRRLTIFVHPGRIKRGVAPRDTMGPVLRTGESYRLVIDARMRDATGAPIAATAEKTITAAAEDTRSPDPSAWILTAPRAPDAAVELQLGEPLDRALLERMIRVEDDAGGLVEGTVTIGASEMSWSFRPRAPWKPGGYRIRVDPALEDLAGNAVGHLFETVPGSSLPPGPAAGGFLRTFTFTPP